MWLLYHTLLLALPLNELFHSNKTFVIENGQILCQDIK